jgi:PIN domain nuclease of toxin-antitoxin system
MSYLLDTHAFLWTISVPKKLPTKIRNIVQSTANDVSLSAVSLWEAAIKIRAGKLDIQGKTPTDLLNEAVALNFTIIDLTAQEAAGHVSLSESTHFDPFDRLLVWQAISRRLTLLSGDREFPKFKKDGLKLLWK